MKKALGWGLGIIAAVMYVKFSLLSHADGCEQSEQEVKAIILQSQSCSSDADCVFTRLSCPFPCITPMRKGTQPDIIAAVNKYHDTCMPMCPDCPKHNPSQIVCENNLCVAR
jgi:hypothetical protein